MVYRLAFIGCPERASNFVEMMQMAVVFGLKFRYYLIIHSLSFFNKLKFN